MSAIFELSEFSTTLSLVLLHSLWQGVALAALALVVTVIVGRRAPASFRHNVHFAALIALALCPVITYAWLGNRAEPLAATEPFAQVSVLNDVATSAIEPATLTSPIATSTLPEPVELSAPVAQAHAIVAPTTPWTYRRFAPYAVAAYAIGVCVMLARLAFGLRGGKRLRKEATPITDSALVDALKRHAHALGVLAVPALAYSSRVAVPTVVGILKPVILLPASFASGFSSEYLELLLLHELAHLKRYDHLLNLLQRVLEAFLFYHPAAWWLSNRIRFERELCCDDLVLTNGGDRCVYVASLLEAAGRAADRRVPSLLAALQAVPGAPTQLRRRVLRLLQEPTPPVRIVRTGWVTAIVLALVSITALAQLELSPAKNVATPDNAVVEDNAEQIQAELTTLAQARRERDVVEPVPVEVEASPIAVAIAQDETDASEQPEDTDAVEQPEATPTDAEVEKGAPRPTPRPKKPVTVVEDPFAFSPPKTPAATAPLAPVNELIGQLHDKNWWLRSVACQQLGEVNDPNVVSALVDCLSDADERVACAAAEALGRQQKPGTVKHLVAALYTDTASRPSKLCVAAANALMVFPPAAVMPYLKLAHRDPEMNAGATLALLRLDTPESVQLALGEIPVEKLEQELAEAYAAPNVVRARAALSGNTLVQRALSNSKSENARAILTGLLRDPDWRVRLYALGTIPDSYVESDGILAPEVVACLSDSDINVRAFTLTRVSSVLTQRIAMRGNVDVLWASIVPVLRDSSRVLANQAANMLAQTEWKPKDEGERVAFALAMSSEDQLEQVGAEHGAEIVPALQGDFRPVLFGLQSHRGDLRRDRVMMSSMQPTRILELAGERGLKEAVPVLLGYATSQDQDVRKTAIAALGKIGDERALDALISAARSETDEKVRYTAIAALAAMKHPKSVDVLVECLSTDLAKAAIPAFVTLSDPRAYATIRDGVLAGKWKGEEVIDAMLNTGGDQAIADLQVFVVDTSRDENFRIQVLNRLAETKKVDIAWFVSLLAQRDSNITATAARALGTLRDDAAVAPLAAAFTANTNLAAFYALTTIDSELSAKAALDILSGKAQNYPDRYPSLIDSVLTMKSPSAFPGVVDMIVQDGLSPQYFNLIPRIAQDAVRKGDKRVEPVLRMMLETAEWRVIAEEGLKSLGLPPEVPAEVAPAATVPSEAPAELAPAATAPSEVPSETAPAATATPAG